MVGHVLGEFLQFFTTDGVEFIIALFHFGAELLILHRLRDGPRWAGRPILALTAHAMAGDAERGLALGFDGYLTKPIDVGNLSAIIRGYLQHDEGAAGAS